MFTLVPSSFFSPDSASEVLRELASLEEGSEVNYIDIPQYSAVLVYSGEDGTVVMAKLLNTLSECSEYNKILCSIQDGCLYLAIAQGKSLLLANSFPAMDFTTALYYIFLSIKSLQLNPELSTICFMTALSPSEEMILYRYFKSVVQL